LLRTNCSVLSLAARQNQSRESHPGPIWASGRVPGSVVQSTQDLAYWRPGQAITGPALPRKDGETARTCMGEDSAWPRAARAARGDEDEGLHLKVEPTGTPADRRSANRENRRISGSPPGKPTPDHLSLQIELPADNAARVTLRTKARKTAENNQNARPRQQWNLCARKRGWICCAFRRLAPT
jgi:hypothetical protein